MSDNMDHPVSSSSASSVELEQLKQDVAGIKKQNEEDKKGFIGWTKKWAGVLAIVAATFAVPKGAIDLYKSFKELNHHPNVELYMPSELDWSYTGEQKLLTLQFPFTIINKGDDYDTVVAITGKLENVSSTIPIAEFDHTDFYCSETMPPQQIVLPLRMGVDSSKAMNCSLSAQLSEDSAKLFLDSIPAAGTLRFTMEMKSENKQGHPLKFCFIADETLKGKVSNPKCLSELGE